MAGGANGALLMMKLALAVALLLGLGSMTGAAAQTTSLECPAKMGEDEDDRQGRCTREASLENYGHQLKTQQEFAELRASLMRQPALSPAKNPLLGRWSLPNAGHGASDDALSQLFGVIGSFASCGPLVGASQIEFLPDSMVSIAGDGERSPAAANYRSGKGGVYALTPLYVMFFEFVSTNRIQLGDARGMQARTRGRRGICTNRCSTNARAGNGAAGRRQRRYGILPCYRGCGVPMQGKLAPHHRVLR